MIFLIDQQLPRRLAVWIRGQGHEAHHIRDLGMEHADDRAIWTEAHARGAVIVTKDEDFSGILGDARAPKVIWLRCGNCSNDYLIARFGELWASLVAELEAGAVLIEMR
ncbi:MAG: DUF5615 family PIN-like protein [Hyphomonadaceae bacterium]|nr:DUF5615 family PIN-like protein [Hyphomonadaceae bacterium]